MQTTTSRRPSLTTAVASCLLQGNALEHPEVDIALVQVQVIDVICMWPNSQPTDTQLNNM